MTHREELTSGELSKSEKSDFRHELDGHQNQLSSLKYLIGGAFIVLLVAFLQLLAAYYQMVRDSYSDYKVALDRASEERSTAIEARLLELEKPLKQQKQTQTPNLLQHSK